MRHEVLRFLLTGSLNTAVSLVVYWLALLVVPASIAYGIAYVFGITFTYYLNARWVFKVPMKWKVFAQFFQWFSLMRFCADQTLLHALIIFGHVDEKIAPLLVLPVTTPLSFLLSRYLLKRKQDAH